MFLCFCRPEFFDICSCRKALSRSDDDDARDRWILLASFEIIEETRSQCTTECIHGRIHACDDTNIVGADADSFQLSHRMNMC